MAAHSWSVAILWQEGHQSSRPEKHWSDRR